MSEPQAMLPCPFCGRTDLLGIEPTPETGYMAVKCRACGTHGPSGRSSAEDERRSAELGRESEAVAHWNRADRGLRAEIESLKDENHTLRGRLSIAEEDRDRYGKHWLHDTGVVEGQRDKAMVDAAALRAALAEALGGWADWLRVAKNEARVHESDWDGEVPAAEARIAELRAKFLGGGK